MDAGRELDGLVAVAMGHKRCPGEEIDHFVDKNNLVYLCKPYSTDWGAAGEAWQWLEQNNHWGSDAHLAIGKSTAGKPAVLVSGYISPRGLHIRYEIEGETYPHAIALAVVENARIGEQR